ncbi:LAFA_0F05490g1_1 [Lachancea sp. 'fantastica']|nr:LAFA_0F05490g1_1 [Lachancea sp. 'fantastica']
MAESGDIAWHEDLANFTEKTGGNSRLLPGFLRTMNRRMKRGGRAGPTSPARRKLFEEVEVKVEGRKDLLQALEAENTAAERADQNSNTSKPSQEKDDYDHHENNNVSYSAESYASPEAPVIPTTSNRRKRARSKSPVNHNGLAETQLEFDAAFDLNSPKKLKSEQISDSGFATAYSSSRKPLVFSSPAKSPSKPLLNKSPFKITLNRHFTPTPLPYEGEYQPPQEKHLTYFFDGFEGYIDQKKPIRANKKSTNSMAMAPQITREDFSLLSNTLNSWVHRNSKHSLQNIQRAMFPQFWFELDQGFSLLFYGIGSKRKFLEEFATEYLSPRLTLSEELNSQPLAVDEAGIKGEFDEADDAQVDADDAEVDGVPCVVINGYNPTCNYRDVFHSISEIMLKEELSKSETKYWSNHVDLQINKMVEVYRNSAPVIKLIVLVHNLDGPMVRKDPFQNMLSLLARVRQIALIASTDHIYAPLLWDHVRAQNFNFVFHDITNYESYAVESSFGDVLKLGKSQGTTGAEGARYVLQSLTTNSKRMYKLLIETQLSAMEGSQSKISANKKGTHTYGIEFKQFYHMCAAEFIASNEVSLRSMLGEFIEHRMAALTKNRSGAETLYVPYAYSEMKALLRDVLDT